MNKLALFLKNKAKPGKREEVHRIWDKHLRPRVEKSKAQELYLFCHDDNDPDTFYIFELYNDREAFLRNGQTDWFAEYMKEVGPLLQEGKAEFGSATPIWAKGISLRVGD